MSATTSCDDERGKQARHRAAETTLPRRCADRVAVCEDASAKRPRACNRRTNPESPIPNPTHTTRPAKAGLVVCERVATPASVTPAPESATTVAPFRAWRGLQPIVAKAPTGATIEGLPGQRPQPCQASRRADRSDAETGGERGIRTLDTGFSRIHTFQACSFNHSDISPESHARTLRSAAE